MPLSAAELVAYRDTSHSAKLYCVVVNPETAWSGQVNDPGAALAIGSRSVIFDGGVLNPLGANWQPFADFTLLVGSTAGARDLGVLRYKSGAAAGAGTLVVDKNHIEWADNSYLTILQEIRPWAKTPDVTGLLEDETETYASENLYMPPFTHIGPPGIVFLDAATENVPWWSSNENTHCQAGGAFTSYTWTFNDGVDGGQAGTEADPKLVAYTTPGFHLVKCMTTWTYPPAVTQTRYSYSVILERSGANAPYMNVEASVSTELSSHGGRASITVFDDDADIDKFTSGSMVILFTEAWYGGTQVNYGGNWTHRENVRFVGWISTDSVKQDPVSGSVTFEATSSAGIPITCWPANLHYDGAAEWHCIPSMATIYGCARAMFHILTEHSTIPSISDVHLPDNDKGLNWIDVSEADIWNQLKQQIGESLGATLAFDLQGALYIEEDVQILPEADRAAIDVMFTVADTDWFDFALGTEEAYEKVAQTDFVAFTYSGVDPEPWYSLAPGRQFSFGSIARGRGVRADTQTEANILAGLYLARANAPFQNNRMAMGGDWFCFDVVPQRYFNFPLAADDTERGLAWTGTAAKMIPRGVQLNWLETGFFEIAVTFAQYAAGPAGTTGEYPDVEPAPEPQPPVVPPPWIPPVGYGHGGVWVFGTIGGGIIYTTDMIVGNPPHFFQLNGGLGDASHIHWGPVGDTCRPSTHLACIDETGEVYVNTNWRNDAAWTLALSEAQAIALLGGGLNGIDLLQVYAHASPGDSTATLFVVTLVDVDGASANKETQIFYSKDWGLSWTVMVQLTGNYGLEAHPPPDYYSTKRFSFDYKRRTAGPGSCTGSLAFRENVGTSGAENIIFAARCGFGGLARSNIARGGYNGWGAIGYTLPCGPMDRGVTNLGGYGGTPDNWGPGAMCVIKSTSGNDQPHFSHWYEHECEGADVRLALAWPSHLPAFFPKGLHVTEYGFSQAFGDYYACRPDMMASAFPTTAIDYWALNIDIVSMETGVLRKLPGAWPDNPFLPQAKLARPCMGLWCYRILVDDGFGNKECVLVAGRGYTAVTDVSGPTDTDLLYLSVDSCDSFIEKGAALYADFGVTGIVGAFSDHLKD